MSAIPQPTSPRFVSERILDPLRQVARRQWTVLATKGVIQTLLTSLGLILAAALILGCFTNIPVWVRVPVALIVWGTVIGSAVRFLRPALQRRSLVRTALEVEQQLRLTRDTQERISSSVELAAETDARFAGSPELIRHLVRQAEADAAAVDPKSVVPADTVNKLAMLLLPLMMLWAGLVWWLPRERILLPMYHLLVPWKAAPALLSHVAVTPGDVTIAQGDNIEVMARVQADRKTDRDRRIEHASLTIVDGAGQPAVHEMTRLAARDFRFPLENLQKTFHYHVSTDEGDSPDYTVTVHPRPSVERLDLRYEYPHYTALEPRDETNSESGAIDAIQGTKVTITVHYSGALKLPDSKLVVTDRMQGVKPEPRDVPLQKSADGTYQAQITLTNSADYAIEMSNDFGLSNKDDQPHPITVRYDEKPTIAITWPQSTMTVRPDDKVPVAFQAGDDFGVSKVEAFVQVDGAADPQPMEVKLRAGDRRALNDKYSLDVAKAMADAKLPDAQGLTYWLKATDNRDPDPQSTESTRQTLRLQKNAASVDRQLDQQRAKDMEAAIRQAIKEVTEEKGNTAPFTWVESNQSLSSEQKQNAEGMKDKVEKTSNDLVAAAEQHRDDAFADIATKAKAISEKSILGAADDLSKVSLHADTFETRKKDAEEATKALETAKTQLEALLKKEDHQAKNVDAADQLKELAKDQQKLAEQQAKAQPNQQPDRSAQQQVEQQTQQAIDKSDLLQNKKAAAEAAKLAELLNKVAEIEKKQQQQEQQVQKQAEAAEAKQQANELAQKQEDLNKKIEQFKNDDKAALQQAGAQPPTQQQEQNIVKELEKNQVQQAANEQNQAAQQLDNAANQLQQKANDNSPQPNAEQQAALNKTQQDAQQAQQQAQQAQQQGQQAQQAQQQAQQAQNAAQQAQNNNNPEQQKNAARQAAQQAAQAAQQAAQAAKQVEQQAKATEKQAEAAAQDNHADVQQAAQAAQQAARQAEKSAQAAQQAAQQAQADAQANDAQKAAQDAAEAAKDAAQAAQQEQNAAQQLAQADNKEGDHAKAEMAQAQKDAAGQAAAEAKQLAQEQRELAQQAQANAQAAQQAQQGAEPPQKAAAEQRELANKDTKQAENQAQQLQQAAQQAGNQELAQRAEAAQQQLKQAAEAQQQAAAAEQAGQPDQAAGQQEKAENALAQAEQALRGEAPQANAGQEQGHPDAGEPDAGKPDAGKPDAGKPDAAQGQEAGKPDSGQGEDAGHPEAGHPESGQGQAEAAEPHPGEPGQGQAQAQAQQASTPEQAAQQAAAHAQEAVQAQQQAMQGQAQASQEAAQALAQAAQEMAQATHPNGQPGQEQGQEAGNEPGQDNDPQHQPSPVASQAADPKMGIQAQANAANGGPPPSVQELGISASDWAKLGPLQQKELINAAQQSGPPSYQSMIKNYYIRLARMQAQGTGQR